MIATATRKAAREPATVLSQATVRAARLLGVPQTVLADVLGVSTATMSRIENGRKQLDPGSKPWQLAALFVRLFRALDAIVGTDEAARAWVSANNLALGGIPLELIRDPAGLARVVDYLDAARARL